MKGISLGIALLCTILLSNCQTSKDFLIFQKNVCYDESLEVLKKRTIYERTASSFADTFSMIQNQRERQPLFEKKIDEAIFFKKDSTECLLIVLQRHDDKNLSFGTARIYRGELFESVWKFKKSMWFSFEEGYFEKYAENSFENISKLARYAVLTNGNFKISGCELDDHYWFEYLQHE
jgi:hypothetical protein